VIQEVQATWSYLHQYQYIYPETIIVTAFTSPVNLWNSTRTIASYIYLRINMIL